MLLLSAQRAGRSGTLRRVFDREQRLAVLKVLKIVLVVLVLVLVLVMLL